MTGKGIPSRDNSEATTRKRLVAFFIDLNPSLL
jgi:hypothetical protein